MRNPATELAPGLAVSDVVKFTSAEDLGDLLAEATAAGRTVVPFGGGRSLLTGTPATADIGLDLSANTGVISYAPADLTLSIRTGTTWASLQQTLAEHGQALPLDIPHPDRTTVGGVVATGFAGARRYRQGSLRDLLIGCEYVRGDGLVAHAGGMVVKNVSGFEIPRFLHGSWGALAILTSVNLKVVPKPRADGTATFGFEHVGRAIAAGIDLVRQGAPVDAIAVVGEAQNATLAVRATGRPRAVSEILAELSVAGAGSSTQHLDEESASWWQSTTDRFAESEDVLLVTITSRIDSLELLATELGTTMTGGSLLVMPGYGSLRLRIPVTDLEKPADTLRQILATVERHGGTCVVESAPLELRLTTSVWGRPDSGATTMTSVKRAFDPAGVLNPGRLFV